MRYFSISCLILHINVTLKKTQNIVIFQHITWCFPLFLLNLKALNKFFLLSYLECIQCFGKKHVLRGTSSTKMRTCVYVSVVAVAFHSSFPFFPPFISTPPSLPNLSPHILLPSKLLYALNASLLIYASHISVVPQCISLVFLFLV